MVCQNGAGTTGVNGVSARSGYNGCKWCVSMGRVQRGVNGVSARIVYNGCKWCVNTERVQRV